MAIRGILVAGGLLLLVLLYSGQPGVNPSPTWTVAAPSGRILGGAAVDTAGAPGPDNSASTLTLGFLAISNQLSALQRDVQDLVARPVAVASAPERVAAPAAAAAAPSPSPCPVVASSSLRGTSGGGGGAVAAPAPYTPVADNPLVPRMGSSRGYSLDGVVVVQSTETDYKKERFLMFLLKDDIVSSAIMSQGWENNLVQMLDYLLATDPNVHNHAVVSGQTGVTV